MDIQQMRYVLEVARAGSIRAAAAALFIAPQTLSEHVQRLERSFNAPLFRRSSNGMTLTGVGEVFVVHATEAVASFDKAAEAVRRAAAGQPVELRLAWANGLADVLQEVLRLVDVDAHPVRMIAMGCVEQRDAMARGEITAGISHYPQRAPLRKGVHRLVVHSAPPVALLPTKHRLAARASVTLAELAGEPLLLPGEAGPSCLRDWEVAEFGRQGLTPRIAAEVSNVDLAVVKVAQGIGYALCVRPGHPVGDGVRFVPVAGHVTPQQVALTWTDDSAAPLAQAARRLSRRPATAVTSDAPR